MVNIKDCDWFMFTLRSSQWRHHFFASVAASFNQNILTISWLSANALMNPQEYFYSILLLCFLFNIILICCFVFYKCLYWSCGRDCDWFKFVWNGMFHMNWFKTNTTVSSIAASSINMCCYVWVCCLDWYFCCLSWL